MIERPSPLPLTRQCELLRLNRAALYYQPVEVSPEELKLMALIDRQYLRTPFYGSRRMAAWLQTQGYMVNRKRAQRLMRLMGLETIYQRPHTSRPAPEHRRYPYLLRGVVIERVNQVWAADITYVPMARGFLYLVAVMDWVSRYVLAWRLSNLLDAICARWYAHRCDLQIYALLCCYRGNRHKWLFSRAEAGQSAPLPRRLGAGGR